MKNPYLLGFIRNVLITVYLAVGGLLWGRFLLRDRVAIFVYHEIDPERFDVHLQYLQRTFGVVPLQSLVESFANKTSFPVGKAVITFDDGWRSNYALLPVIKKHEVSVTIFLLAGMVGTNRQIWNYPLREVRPDLNDVFKRVPHRERLARLAKLANYYPEKEYPERVFLSHEEIQLMTAYVDFQSHGSFHPPFITCNAEDLRADLQQAREYLENLTGRSVDCLAYPYGRGLVSSREAAIAGDIGYRIGRVASAPGLVNADDDPLLLPSLNVPGEAGIAELKRIIAWGQISTLMGRKLC